MRRTGSVALLSTTLVLAASCGSREAEPGPERERPGERASERAAARPGVAPAPTPPEAVSAPPPLSDLGSRLAADVEAAPPWSYAQEMTRAIVGPNHRTNVPQPADPGALFDTLGEDAASVGAGLLLCRLTIARDRRWDAAGLFGANISPDPTVRLWIGDGPLLTIRLPEDTYEAPFSVPGVTLQVSTPLRLRVVDRDVARDDEVGDGTASWSGERLLRIEAGEATARCALAGTVWLGPHLARASERARQAVRRLERERPRPRPAATDAEGSGLADARRGVHAVAALTGWTSAAAAPLLGRVKAWEARYFEAHAALVRRLTPDATALGETAALGHDVRLRLTRFRCEDGGAPRSCEVELETRGDTPQGSASALHIALVAPGVAASRCLPVRAHLEDREGSSRTARQPRTSSTSCAAPTSDGDAGSWLLVVERLRDRAVLRVDQ